MGTLDGMRVFVVGTGRCGSVTFYQACSHMTNFSSGHETLATQKIGCLNYPDDHIECSPPLLLSAPALIKAYPDAKWIHLVRERESCIKSLEGQVAESLKRFAGQWWLRQKPEPKSAAPVFYDTCIGLAEALLPRDRMLVVQMESAYQSWEEVWAFLGAQGNFEASRNEWLKKYNSGKSRGRESFEAAAQMPKTS